MKSNDAGDLPSISNQDVCVYWKYVEADSKKSQFSEL
jgi:hypothetical protein